MLLAIDTGNTQTVIGLFDGAELADHWRIAVAIAERNAAQAEQAMRLHLNAVQKRLIEHAFPDAAAAE